MFDAKEGMEVSVDSSVIHSLPSGSKVIKAVRYGHSDWSALTAKLTIENDKGVPAEYFLKIVTGPDAHARVVGEHSSMSSLFEATRPTTPMDQPGNDLSSLIPQPRDLGKCSSPEGDYFFLIDFKQIIMHNEASLPDPVQLGHKMALLHKKTGGTSPSGHFGCDRNKVPYDGKLPLLGGWEEDWSSYFTNLLKLSYSHALRVHSRTDLEEIMDATYNKLIPRLIEPLNRKIQPCLIHGDLWESNIGTDKSSGEIYIFDAAAYWAHNEKELGIWFCSHHAMHARFEEYAEAYWDAYGCGKQGPDGEWRQRVQLYSTQTMFMRCGSVRDDECWEAIMMTLTALLDTYCLNWDDRETAGMNLQQH